MPVIHASHPCYSSMPVIHASHPCQSSMPVIYASHPSCQSSMLFIHAIHPCQLSMPVVSPPPSMKTNYTNKTKPKQTKPYQTILIHTKPYHISSLYLQLSITAISIHNATLLACHFRKIATVSHFRLVLFKASERKRETKNFLYH